MWIPPTLSNISLFFASFLMDDTALNYLPQNKNEKGFSRKSSFQPYHSRGILYILLGISYTWILLKKKKNPDCNKLFCKPVFRSGDFLLVYTWFCKYLMPNEFRIKEMFSNKQIQKKTWFSIDSFRGQQITGQTSFFSFLSSRS